MDGVKDINKYSDIIINVMRYWNVTLMFENIIRLFLTEVSSKARIYTCAFPGLYDEFKIN